MAGEVVENNGNILDNAGKGLQSFGKALDRFASKILDNKLLLSLKVNVAETIKIGLDNIEGANFENYRSICDALSKIKQLSGKHLFMAIVKDEALLTKLLLYADLNEAAKNYTEASTNNNGERDMVVAQIHALVEPLVMLLNKGYKGYRLRMDGSDYVLMEPSIDNGALGSYTSDGIPFNRFDNNPNPGPSQGVDTKVIQNTAQLVVANENITDLTQLSQPA